MCYESTPANNFYDNGYSATAIANEFLHLARQEGRNLTNMQLQKLPYIAHGWNLALRDKPLIREQPRVWQYGPVYRTLYDALKIHGADPIDDYIYDNGWNTFIDHLYNKRLERGNIIKANLEDDDHQLINAVWNEYKKYDAFQLSALTHKKNTPWSIIKDREGEGALIDNKIIRQHYHELAQR